MAKTDRFDGKAGIFYREQPARQSATEIFAHMRRAKSTTKKATSGIRCGSRVGELEAHHLDVRHRAPKEAGA
jgi:hypothetical protein